MSKIGGINPTVKLATEAPKPEAPKAAAQKQTVQNPLDAPGRNAKLGELGNLAASAKNALSKLFDGKTAAAAPPSPTAPNVPNVPNVPTALLSPSQALDRIKTLPKPNRDGIPADLPPDRQDDIYQGRVRDHNQQRASIADEAVKNAAPPKKEDFKNLPPQVAEKEYNDAVAAHNQQVGELKQISREAKQANLEADPEFKKLPAETQEQVRAALIANQASVQDVDTLTKLAAAPGFNKISPDEQKKFLSLVGGTNKEISAPARRELDRMFGDAAIDKTNPETFRKFLTDQPGLAGVVAQNAEPGEFDARRRPYNVTGPTEVKDHGFQSGKADALRYEVEIDGKKVPVYMPKNPDPNETYQTIDEVAKALAALPKVSFDSVNSVSVNPGRNPDDAYWAKEYNRPDFRSYMTAGSAGDISIYPGKQPQQVADVSLVHETGHILSKRILGENTDGGFIDSVRDFFGATTWNDWKEAAAKDGVSPSAYARSSPDEDFAETLALYMKVKGTPREAEIRAIMPERFALMDQILENR